MDTKKFIVLDIDYFTKNNVPAIRLFGRIIDEDNDKSIIALDSNFKPYMYVFPNIIENCIQQISEFELLKV